MVTSINSASAPAFLPAETVPPPSPQQAGKPLLHQMNKPSLGQLGKASEAAGAQLDLMPKDAVTARTGTGRHVSHSSTLGQRRPVQGRSQQQGRSAEAKKSKKLKQADELGFHPVTHVLDAFEQDCDEDARAKLDENLAVGTFNGGNGMSPVDRFQAYFNADQTVDSLPLPKPKKDDMHDALNASMTSLYLRYTKDFNQTVKQTEEGLAEFGLVPDENGKLPTLRDLRFKIFPKQQGKVETAGVPDVILKALIAKYGSALCKSAAQSLVKRWAMGLRGI